MKTVHGADVYIDTEREADLPKQVGPFTLLFFSDKGTRVYPPPAPDIERGTWIRVRYFSEDSTTDKQVQELTTSLVDAGFAWNQVIKLYRVDGANGFSQPY